jgi:K+-transporting ATPase ATPase A chain
LLAVVMWLGRFAFIVPVLAIAGSLAGRSASARPPARCRPTDRLFVALLIGTVVLVGALTYVPALALGPCHRTFAAFSRD